MSDKTGGPAFPVVGHMFGEQIGGQLAHGMTLRDYFMAAVMQGMLASLSAKVVEPDIFVNYCGEIADAMMKERSK